MAGFTPRLAGFLAGDISEQRTDAYATVLRPRAHGPSVTPQLIWWTGECIPNCVCVKQEGCPCCGYGDPFGRIFGKTLAF